MPNKVKKKTRIMRISNTPVMDLFGRKQEEELVRMKVCIVQQGETIDDLAQRYGVTVQSLLLSNELEGNQSVTEGQVIYIPKSIAYKN